MVSVEESGCCTLSFLFPLPHHSLIYNFFVMDLNICLYCEKPLSDDNTSFCSLACQDQEASKNFTYSHSIHYHHSPSMYSHHNKHVSNQTAMLMQSTPRSILSAKPPAEILPYHRRRSFFYSKDHSVRARSNVNSLVGTQYGASSEYSLSSITATDACYSLYSAHILDNTSSISTVSYESSETDSVLT
ncbi:hypothetical protein BX666DRAFT_67114 [Dichotomocladium elegans]|nr:hypothetical protein BX666DRAFT_67114 [Dichotomocladium elegans]